MYENGKKHIGDSILLLDKLVQFSIEKKMAKSTDRYDAQIQLFDQFL